MIGRICLLLEALSVVICLHHLYGEKFKLDIKTVGFLAIDMIMMTAIDYYGLPSTWSISIYLIMAMYCALKFGADWRCIVINELLSIAFVGIGQLIAAFICYSISGVQYFEGEDILIINTITIFMIKLLVPKIKLVVFLKYLQQKEKMTILSLFLCVGLLLYYMVNYKKINIMIVHESVVLFIVILFICVLVAQLEKYKMKSIEVETELKMQRIYADSFDKLIENIRLRQHEFDNHINAIFSQHYMYHTYEGLVDAQKNYCKCLLEENRYNNLLTKGNPIIICFLYDKFIEVEKLGIKVSYQISVAELEVGMPIYKIVEILGNLIQNAVEAMLIEDVEKHLYVAVMENKGIGEIRVRNISQYISKEEIRHFFEKGYSTKGENRGLGLYNVKRICDEYNFMILCDNVSENDSNWVEFKITNFDRILRSNK